jgi:hypothetical protein
LYDCCDCTDKTLKAGIDGEFAEKSHMLAVIFAPANRMLFAA